jgi:hypothetical protein
MWNVFQVNRLTNEPKMYIFGIYLNGIAVIKKIYLRG